MTAPRDTDRLVSAFLEEGQTELPVRAYDEVRRDIHQTRQRVVIGPWKAPAMTNIARLAIAASAVVAVGLAWVNLGPSNSVGTQPTPTPTATSTPIVTPTPAPMPSAGTALLEPGGYRFVDTVMPMAITVPAGWSASDGFVITKNEGTPAELALAPWAMVNTYVDPCTDHTLVSPAPGTSVDDIANALANQPGTEAGPPRPVTVDGFSGKLVELTITTDIATCNGLNDGFWLWFDGNDHRFAQGTNEQDRLYILDVDGFRFAFAAAVQEGSSAKDRAELDAIIASVDIKP